MKNKIHIIFNAQSANSANYNDMLCKLVNGGHMAFLHFLGYCPQCEYGDAPFIDNANVKFTRLKSTSDYYPVCNDIINNIKTGYVFFLSSEVIVNSHALTNLARTLQQNGRLVGINPILVDAEGDNASVLHMGTVADHLGQIHYLYEGIRANHMLAGKERKFLLANSQALMLRAEDFINAGGFSPQLDDLAFPEFCLRLCRTRQGSFGTAPDIRLVSRKRNESIQVCGLWNSLLWRDKLPLPLPPPDYHRHIAEDNLEYGVSDWLAEGPVNLDEACNVFGLWRLKGDPRYLVSFLSGLSAPDTANLVQICRNYPDLLPHQFEFYKDMSQRQLYFAQKSGLDTMEKSILKWQKSPRIFRLGKLKPALSILAQAGIYNCSLDRCPSIYDAWLELAPKADTITVEKSWPKISVAMPVYNPPSHFLKAAINSVKSQTYPNWELCIADDHSPNPYIQDILRHAQKGDNRIKIKFREQNGHISRATNSAIELATSPWLTFLDHDDLLEPDALAEVAAAAGDAIRFIYSDEDHIDEHGARRSPIFANDCEHFYLPAHLIAYRTEDARATGCLRTGFEGAQDMDLRLRVSERLQPGQFRHISKILYHWRIHGGSLSGSLGAKPYALAAIKKTLEEYSCRKGQQAIFVPSQRKFIFNPIYKIPENFPGAIVLLGRGTKIHSSMRKMLEKLGAEFNFPLFWQPMNANKPGWQFKGQILEHSENNWWLACKRAAEAVEREVLLFLDSGLAPENNCQPEQLLFAAAQETTGAAGSMIWRGEYLANGGIYPDITGLPFMLLKNVRKSDLPYCCWWQFLHQHRTIGISWRAMAIRRKNMMAVNIENYNNHTLEETELGLLLEQDNMEILVSPWGQWQMNEGARPGGSVAKVSEFLRRWGQCVRSHGLRNPNLRAAPDFGWTMNLK